MDTQAVILDGVRNARELGGYPVGDRRIKRNTLLRTGKLTTASDTAIDKLVNTYRLRYIVDFRTTPEQIKSPDVDVPGCDYLAMPVMEMSEMKTSDPEMISVFSNPASSPMELFNVMYNKNYINKKLYTDFLLKEKGIKAYRDFFRTVLSLDEGRSVLWHCTDGKDRAGLASMLILSALGASRETIIDDYMLTNHYNKARLSEAEKTAAEHGLSPEKTEVFLFLAGGVIQGFMENAIDTLHDRYGSVTGYIQQELKVTDADLRFLRDRFLEY